MVFDFFAHGGDVVEPGLRLPSHDKANETLMGKGCDDQ
jgi:hypothetical protein